MPIGLIVHGGAGLLATDDHEAVMAGCKAAVEAGLALLRAGRSAVDAVEASVRVLEDNPLFNAGYGSVLNSDGIVEMDALIMEGGRNLIGGVAGVRRVRNPVSLARCVMEKTPHHLIVGEGAERVAIANAIPLVDPQSMISPGSMAEWREYIASRDAKLKGHDTVGAVALDLQGGLAVAVSTGGLTDKMPGRVGDSPMAGAGGYASNGAGAACATGVGETIIRSMLTFRAVQAIENGANAQSAADGVMPVFARYDGDGGLITIDALGRVGVAHNTPFLPVGWWSELEGGPVRAQVAVKR
jgi:L-asparaginase / beta-aspartyl-peptidase